MVCVSGLRQERERGGGREGVRGEGEGERERGS